MKLQSVPSISKERLKNLPKKPGVYLMKDAAGTVLYVGKAKNLFNRVRSYFLGNDGRASVPLLLERVEHIETLITADERQAILLESDLITKYKPHYNIRLKDDKAYLIVRIDLEQQWPRLEMVRRVEDDGARYIGPFVFSHELRAILEVIKRVVPLRTCSDRVFHNRVRPCLEYQIKRCAGPCCLAVDREAYLEWIETAIRLLEGKSADVVEELERAMERASEELRFEDAATMRDRIQALERAAEDRQAMLFSAGAKDGVALYREGSRIELAVSLVRNGRLFEGKSFGFTDVEAPDEEVLASFLMQFYADSSGLPDEVYLPFEIEDADSYAEILSERRGRSVKLSVPKRGEKSRLVALAAQNAEGNFRARLSGADQEALLVRALKEDLGLEQMPRTIECIDISHFQGGATVGCVVCFQDGRPDKSRYRHFVLDMGGKPDDFASMREVVQRHLLRGAEAGTLADLIIIDGGRGQLSQAVAERAKIGLNQPEMIGLAKKRSGPIPYRMQISGKARARVDRPERVYLEGASVPIVLNPTSDTVHLLERIRDEAHRFAITHHRKRRSKGLFRSALEGIQGVGPKRRAQLLRAFGSVKKLREASPEELTEKCGLSQPLAERIVETLRRLDEARQQGNPE